MVSERVFVDTNIFLDFFFDRKDGIRPLGFFAAEFIKKALDCQYILLISETTINEINRVLQRKSLLFEEHVFYNLKDKKKLDIVIATDLQIQNAKSVSKARELPFADCLYSIIARDFKIVVVSRDKDFEELRDIAECFKPEEL